MVEALSTALLGIVSIFGGMYLALRFIVLAERPAPPLAGMPPAKPQA